ncbi:unnamed protein product [Adineta steineri]|uniref:Protein sleepless n=1 Tax=Adineta steineri TaxID=433720 RepID=A0A814W9L1_9BILA|nr:unnamed protein product [Adineta steineri]CAF1199450.1 unnamed protein product [Adineta steineri]CAF3679610.1 unnamed protein product [Adineta steineri]CAF3776108.1 unnamed protein product [Adineta steineri]
MQRLAVGITILLLVVLSFYSTDAIRCYVCNTVDTLGCGTKINTAKLNTTNTTYIVAINSTQRCTKRQLSDLYVRGFGDATACPHDENTCNKTSLADLTVADCCCNSDLCNGVSSIQHQYSILIFGISVLIVINNIFTV